MSRQNTTNGDNSERWVLSPQQETAIDLLAVGKTVTQVSAEVGVARQTVSEWLNHQPGFQAAFNQRRQELWDAVSDRLRSLLPKALDVLDQAIDRGDLKAALEILKSAMHRLQRPEGPTSAEEAHVAAKESENARQRRALIASLG
jgi:hypothetical protein